jgi:hypothetical protein
MVGGSGARARFQEAGATVVPEGGREMQRRESSIVAFQQRVEDRGRKRCSMDALVAATTGADI